MNASANHWRRMAQCYFEQWQQAEEELKRSEEDDVTMPVDKSGSDFYRLAVYWIVKERAGGGGWPPQDIKKVSGWMVVRLVADVFGRNPIEVANDVIARRPVASYERRSG